MGIFDSVSNLLEPSPSHANIGETMAVAFKNAMASTLNEGSAAINQLLEKIFNGSTNPAFIKIRKALRIKLPSYSSAKYGTFVIFTEGQNQVLIWKKPADFVGGSSHKTSSKERSARKEWAEKIGFAVGEIVVEALCPQSNQKSQGPVELRTLEIINQQVSRVDAKDDNLNKAKFTEEKSCNLVKIRELVEPRVLDWLCKSPGSAVSQGRWMLEHPNSTLEQRCFALRLLSLTGTAESNSLLANYYSKHQSDAEFCGLLTPGEWNSAGVRAEKIGFVPVEFQSFDNSKFEPERHLVSSPSAVALFTLAPDNASSIIRIAIDLLKQNPTAFLSELAELHSLVLANKVTSPSQAAFSEELPSEVDATPLAKVARWLLNQESVTPVALRTYLLPLDLLPEAMVDELNEWALDLIGELALEEIGDEIVVVRSVLAEALSLWSQAAGLTVQKE